MLIMLKLDMKNNIINQDKEHKSSFLIEPLESNQSISLGHFLRRDIISNTPGVALSSVSLNDVIQEFDFIKGTREDIFEIILNLKELSFSSKFNNKTNFDRSFLLTNGPRIVTAKFFHCRKNDIRIINAQKYICTLTETRPFFLELILKRGKGYLFEDKKQFQNYYKKNNNFIVMNSNFCPVKIINYNTNLCYNNKGLIKESLIINITTNGCITPSRCILESLKSLNENLQFLINQIIFAT